MDVSRGIFEDTLTRLCIVKKAKNTRHVLGLLVLTSTATFLRYYKTWGDRFAFSVSPRHD